LSIKKKTTFTTIAHFINHKQENAQLKVSMQVNQILNDILTCTNYVHFFTKSQNDFRLFRILTYAVLYRTINWQTQKQSRMYPLQRKKEHKKHAVFVCITQCSRTKLFYCSPKVFIWYHIFDITRLVESFYLNPTETCIKYFVFHW